MGTAPLQLHTYGQAVGGLLVVIATIAILTSLLLPVRPRLRVRVASGKHHRPRTETERIGLALCLRERTERGRSPSAARGQAEALSKRAMSSGLTTRCEPGRFAVQYNVTSLPG